MVKSIEDARRHHITSSGRAAAGRVPPYNLQAEESLLGAMLLSRDAIAAAVEGCSADDFYKPAHGHVFDAVCSLYGQGAPADPVTVADELRRADLLDAIGGPATLITLQANTPATTNAARYARIVSEHAILRRLIAVAGDIAEMGYSVPEDVTAAVDRAETLVFEVAEHRVTNSLRPLPELLSETLDRLASLYGQDKAITGLPTGFFEIDECLAGLQNSTLVIVGARPSMGKALSLDTPLPTPTGWTTMGALRTGDQVLDEEGRACTVGYATPVMYGRTCYRVRFDDGSSLVADADHQWSVHDIASPGARARVVTTQQMIDVGVRAHPDRRPNWYVPVAAPLDLEDRVLPVDPYLLGVRLAWGVRDPAGAATRLPEMAGAALADRHAGTPRPAGLDEYLRSSRRQRLALLQGLMDTRGRVERNGRVEIRLSDLTLLSQVRELAHSLGHKPGLIRRTAARAGRHARGAGRLSWMPSGNVFGGGAKAERLALFLASPAAAGRERTQRAVTSIEPCPSVPVRCITVDSPSHLYLAGDAMIPTHNTAFALNITANAAMTSHVPVLFFSLEMSHSEVTQRLLCSEARVSSTRVRTGRLHESDWPKISHAIGRLGEAQIFIDDNPNVTVMEIRAKARRLKSRHEDLGLIVVDYLQLMTGRHGAENRQVEVAEISRGLKILARELNIPVVALSQLSRNLEQRADKRPMLADLRESGSLEQDADVVMFLYRDEVYNTESPDRGSAEVIISKHRNGPTGLTQLAFLGDYTRFENMARM